MVDQARPSLAPPQQELQTHPPGPAGPAAAARTSRARHRAEALLARADVRIDGDRPWDLQVHDDRLFQRVAWQGSLGLGESYMDGWWDVEDLDGFFHRVLRAGLDREVAVRLPAIWNIIRSIAWNLQRGRRAFRIGERHYDISNELYRHMLDARMIYSCGYWADAQDLDAAQEAKLELICRKLELGPGMRLLDIGCGWGGLVRYAAEHHDVDAVGLTVSREQARLARDACRDLPVEIRFQDYRALGSERFDRIVSVGMFEHVGSKNHAAYMRVAHDHIAPDGLHLLHTIGRPRSTIATDPWISRYIFPNSMLPSLAQITRAADGLFVVEDVHNIGPHYDPTLRTWWDNVSRHWDQIAPHVRDPARFRRMWRYYLLSSAGAFRAGTLQVWQVLMSPHRGRPGGVRRLG